MVSETSVIPLLVTRLVAVNSSDAAGTFVDIQSEVKLLLRLGIKANATPIRIMMLTKTYNHLIRLFFWNADFFIDVRSLSEVAIGKDPDTIDGIELFIF